MVFDDSISATGVQIDSKGTMFISDINGNIYRRETGGEFVKIYDRFHSLSKGIQLAGDDTLYLSTLGGGLLKLEGLSGLYSAPTEPANAFLPVALPIIVVLAVTAIVFIVIFVRGKKSGKSDR